MKNLSAALQAHLDTGATTMALCWRITRTDSVVQGFTEHDRDLIFDGTTFEASTGFNASKTVQSLGLAVDNLELEGAISADTITEADLAAGRYDNADVELFWVNWRDVAERVIIARGSVGEVKRHQTAFIAEFRSQVHNLNQKTGRAYQRTCDAAIGDSRCKVNLTDARYRGTGTIGSANGRILQVAGLSAFADGWFSHGLLTFSDGPNVGVEIEVKEHKGTQLTLWQEPPAVPQAGNAYFVTVGCGQTWEICRDKFANLANFQGFPDIPGRDTLSAVAITGERAFTGGSLR